METPKKYVVTGTFEDREKAEKAFLIAQGQNCSEEDLDVLMSEKAQKTYFADSKDIEIKEKSQTLEGAGVGGAVGLSLGALVAGVLAVGAPITVPGLVVAGPLAGALVGAGAGSAAGTIVGGLVGAGMKKEQAELYKSSIEAGHIVMSAKTDNNEDAEQIADKWRGLGAKVYTW